MNRQQTRERDSRGLHEGSGRELTRDETALVSGGFPLAVIAIAVACAVLLAHD